MLVKLRLAVGVALIWIAAVAGVSVTAWVAIDRAGRDVNGAGVNTLPPVSGGVPTAPTTKTPSTASSQPATSQPTTGSSTVPRDRTVSVVGGQASVTCSGTSVTLRSAQPDDGWRVEVDKSGPGEVEVRFRSGDGDTARSTQVKAVCSAAAPVFTVEKDG